MRIDRQSHVQQSGRLSGRQAMVLALALPLASTVLASCSNERSGYTSTEDIVAYEDYGDVAQDADFTAIGTIEEDLGFASIEAPREIPELPDPGTGYRLASFRVEKPVGGRAEFLPQVGDVITIGWYEAEAGAADAVVESVDRLSSGLTVGNSYVLLLTSFEFSDGTKGFAVTSSDSGTFELAGADAIYRGSTGASAKQTFSLDEVTKVLSQATYKDRSAKPEDSPVGSLPPGVDRADPLITPVDGE